MPEQRHVDRVARRAGHVADEHALLAQQPVDERRLARRWADRRWRTGLGRRVGAGGWGPTARLLLDARVADAWLRARRPAPGLQPLHDLVEQLRDAGSVLGRDLEDRVEPELEELHRRLQRSLVVGLVDRQQHRPAGLAQLARDALVAGNQPLASVDQQHEQVGADDRALALLARPARAADPGSRRTARRYRTAGTIAPRQTTGRASASRVVPAIGRDDRPAAAGHPVEQRRLADVRAADERRRMARSCGGHVAVRTTIQLSLSLDSVSAHNL